MSYRSYLSEFVLDSEADHHQGTLVVYLSSTLEKKDDQEVISHAENSGRKVEVVNCLSPEVGLPNLFEMVPAASIGQWLSHAIISRPASSAFKDRISEYTTKLINGLILLGRDVGFDSLQYIVKDPSDLYDLVSDLDRDHHDVAGLSVQDKATFHEIKGIMESDSEFSHLYRAAMLPVLSYLAKRNDLFVHDRQVSWVDVLAAESILVIEFDFMNRPGESIILSRLLSERMSHQPGLTGISS